MSIYGVSNSSVTRPPVTLPVRDGGQVGNARRTDVLRPSQPASTPTPAARAVRCLLGVAGGGSRGNGSGALERALDGGTRLLRQVGRDGAADLWTGAGRHAGQPGALRSRRTPRRQGLIMTIPIQGFQSLIPPQRSIGLDIAGENGIGGLQLPSDDGPSFGDTLKRAIGEVSAAQDNAQDQVQKFLNGEPVELHQVMAASEEASVWPPRCSSRCATRSRMRITLSSTCKADRPPFLHPALDRDPRA